MPSPCRLCPGRTFPHAQALEQHKAAVHCFPCDQCGRIFRTPEANEQHIQAAHPLNHCRRCNRMFKTAAALDLHILDTHPIRTCVHCGRAFPSKAVLDHHILAVHPTYHCHPCDRLFRTEELLHQHETDVHSQTWPCRLCTRMFGSIVARAQHEQDFVHLPSVHYAAPPPPIHRLPPPHPPPRDQDAYTYAYIATAPTAAAVPTSPRASRTLPARGNLASGSRAVFISTPPPILGHHSQGKSPTSIRSSTPFPKEEDDEEEEEDSQAACPFIFSPRPTSLPMTASFIALPTEPTPPPTTSPRTTTTRKKHLPMSDDSDADTAIGDSSGGRGSNDAPRTIPLPADQSNRADEPSHSPRATNSVYFPTMAITPEVEAEREEVEVDVPALGTDLRLDEEDPFSDTKADEPPIVPPLENEKEEPATATTPPGQAPSELHAPSPQRTDGATNVRRLQELAEEQEAGETFVEEVEVESDDVIVMVKRPSGASSRSGSWEVTERMEKIKEARYRERERLEREKLEVEEEIEGSRELSKEQRAAIMKGLAVLGFQPEAQARRESVVLPAEQVEDNDHFQFLPSRRASEDDPPSSSETFVLPSGELMTDFGMRPRSWDLWKPSSNFVPTPIAVVPSLDTFEGHDFDLLHTRTPAVSIVPPPVKKTQAQAQAQSPRAAKPTETVSWMTWQPDPAIIASTTPILKQISPIGKNGELNARVTSWAAWKQPCSPATENPPSATITSPVLADPKSPPGLFGPRSPILPTPCSPKSVVSEKRSLPALTTTFGGPRSPKTSPHSSSFDAPSSISAKHSWGTTTNVGGGTGGLVSSPEPLAAPRLYPVSRVISPSSSICLQSPVESWNDLEEKVSAYLSENGSGSRGSGCVEALPAPTAPAPPALSLQCRICKKAQCEDTTATMCGHLFCNPCITEAVIATSKCPVCKTATLLYCLFRLDLAASA